MRFPFLRSLILSCFFLLAAGPGGFFDSTSAASISVNDCPAAPRQGTYFADGVVRTGDMGYSLTGDMSDSCRGGIVTGSVVTGSGNEFRIAFPDEHRWPQMRFAFTD